MTMDDTKTYIQDTLGQNDTFRDLSIRDREYSSLVDEIGDAAQEVFLWVHLACNSLLDGFTKKDKIHHLRERLRLLPHRLIDMYKHIISTIDPIYCTAAARSFLVISSPIPLTDSLLHFYLDDHECEDACKAEAVDEDGFHKDGTEMKRRMNIRCKGLLNVQRGNSKFWRRDNVNYPVFELYSYSVIATHRTLIEFLKMPATQACLTRDANTGSDSSEILCRAFLAKITTTLLRLVQLKPIEYIETRENKVPFEWTILLHDLVRDFVKYAERLNPVHSYQHWVELWSIADRIHVAGETGLHIIIRSAIGFGGRGTAKVNYQLPSRPRMLHIAIAHDAINFVNYELDNNPETLLLRSGEFPALLMALIRLFYHSPGKATLPEAMTAIVHALLEIGADPNETYGSTTPWKAFLVTRLYEARFLSNTNCVLVDNGLISDLMAHGADLDVSCDVFISGHGYVRRKSPIYSADGIYKIPHDAGPRYKFSVSAAAIVQNMVERMDIDQRPSKDILAKIPPVGPTETLTYILGRLPEKIE